MAIDCNVKGLKPTGKMDNHPRLVSFVESKLAWRMIAGDVVGDVGFVRFHA
jgi:hypothetical protein